MRAGFVKNGVIGEEGSRFVYRGKEDLLAKQKD